jgi:hypothetical protein
MNPEQLSEFIDEPLRADSVREDLIDKAAAILDGSVVGQDIVFEGRTLLNREVWTMLSDDDLILEVAVALKEGEAGKAESKVYLVLRDLTQRIVNRAEEMGLPAEVTRTGDDEHAHPFIVEIQAGKNERFPESQVVQVTVYDSDDIAVELPLDIAEKIDAQNYQKFKNPTDVVNVMRAVANFVQKGEVTKAPVAAPAEKPVEKPVGKPEKPEERWTPEHEKSATSDKLDVARWVKSSTQPPAAGGMYSPPSSTAMPLRLGERATYGS